MIEERIKHLVVALRLINRDMWKWQEQYEGRHGHIASANMKRTKPIRDGIEAKIKWLLSQAEGP